MNFQNDYSILILTTVSLTYFFRQAQQQGLPMCGAPPMVQQQLMAPPLVHIRLMLVVIMPELHHFLAHIRKL